ncbi:hypothetical protein OB2597_10656 [Pseudooceanicola batsensis HTCC2597]|uniref:Methylamine utilization protein MauE n=1 Tax=Pseudooceanicola batsensis (strain ATCC BAA-863 / DSM 15984 / KCTC 12145 / HTCC2597) TaxID=252305 RepID=A3TVQ1_PSEBH|nr:glutaredoxin [Pseudooceanicola batsensis]EAQ03697.1 hypothetical protein OB2597_10656 [Pseudooceanicola batsensis HTCC2597]
MSHAANATTDHSLGTAGEGTAKRAVLFRMAMPDHLCPYGQKSKAFLKRAGYEVEDHLLTTREETDAFMEKEGVSTTPQTYIGGERIGGYEEVRAFLDMPLRDEDETTYQPVIALFGTAALMAVALAVGSAMPLWSARTLELFIAFSMTLLALQKLRDIESFSTMFLNYDLLARRWVWYGYIYPVGEALAGLFMLAVIPWVAAPIAIFIGAVGAVSVFKAVYIDKRELKCACMGGSSNVPLGFVSLTENLMMLGAGIWMMF